MLVALLSVKGSPGVTTFSVALAARWPAPARPLVVEADPSGGDIAVRFSLASTPGLVSLAAAARRSNNPALLWQHVQTLPGGLPVVTAPPDADRARAALSAFTGEPSAGVGVLRVAANAPGVVVIVDCGRIDAGSPAMPIVRSADAMVLLTRAHADDLAHLPCKLPTLGRWTPYPVMMLVGDGYSSAEVSRELGVPPLARIPHDPRGAAVLCGRPGARRWGRTATARSALGEVARNVARTLVAQQTATPALPRQGPSDSEPLPSTPAMRTDPVSSGGLRLAASPQPSPEGTSPGGAS